MSTPPTQGSQNSKFGFHICLNQKDFILGVLIGLLFVDISRRLVELIVPGAS